VSDHLTITRFGLLASDTSFDAAPRLSGENLLRAFREQANNLNERISEKTPPEISQSGVTELVGLPHDDRDIDDQDPTEDIAAAEKRREPYRGYIAVLPRREFTAGIAGTKWHIRHKISMTSCSLQDRPGRSKLWISVEAIPLSEQPNISGYLDNLALHEDSFLNFFREAFEKSLRKTAFELFANSFTFADKPIKISLTDDDTRPVALVLEAIDFDGLTEKQVSNDPALQEGWSKLRDFVSHAAPASLDATSADVVVESMPPAIKGLIYKYEDSPRYLSLVAGFAKHAGDGGGYQEVLDRLDRTLDEPESVRFNYVRARSAALRLSAELAQREARRIDSRPREFRY
jgi:hypothetical protein